jgi:TRAP-type C4-dicarboxylate transport system permease small subunit
VDDPKSFASLEAEAARGGSEGPIEKLCKLLCAAAIIVMLAVIGEDVLSRSIWNTSRELSDEIGGYMLIAVAFLGLAVVKTNGAFHRTDYFQSRLPYKAQVASRILFDLLALAVALILLWQYYRYTASRFASGSTAPTRLGTPQWIPAVPMVLGVAAYVLAIGKSLMDNLRRFGAPPGDGRGAWDLE